MTPVADEHSPIREFLGDVGDLLSDPDVIEINANPDGQVYVDRFRAGRTQWGHMNAAHVERFLRWCAARTDTTITRDTPRLKGRIPGTAHRIAGMIPPIVDAPMFSIRRHLERILPLEMYIQHATPLGMIKNAIHHRQNILIAGATGAGKTTLLNACLDTVAHSEPHTRLIVIEDTPEIRHPLADHVAMRTSDTIGMDDLLVDTLRHAPTRIVVGEVRTGAVLMTLLKAWNTGHPGGFATLHANSADEVMDRLWTLGTEVMSADPTPALLQATDMIVFVRRRPDGPPDIAAIAERRGDRHNRTMETIYEV